MATPVLLLLLLLPVDALGGFTTPIENIVVLMLENRPFDHMLGFLEGVDGLKGDESNPVDTKHPHGARVSVARDSPYIAPFDPNHGTPATTSKIFGKACLEHGGNCSKATMDGFIEFAVSERGFSVEKAANLLKAFTPDRVPIISTLAKEFAVFDQFHCSHPGPTFPNRLFTLMGSSKGCTETSHWDPEHFLFTGRTIFDLVEEAGKSWNFYYADAPLEMALVEKVTLSPLKVKGWKEFHQDAASGRLPTLSWLNPRWFVNFTTMEGASDQHPDHDVRMGERLIKETYELLRSSPQWNRTLLVITYDEHGGFYDHVPPPMGVPPPDSLPSFPDKGFPFDRLGIRVPTLLVSPWVSKGNVISHPHQTEKPSTNSAFELTSIAATVKKLLGAQDRPFLTKRDAWAATFEGRLRTREAGPRTDCPAQLPAAPKSLGEVDARREAALPLNDLQADIVRAFDLLRQRQGIAQPAPLPTLQGDASKWMEGVVSQILEAAARAERQGE
jgi:phospholipase C